MVMRVPSGTPAMCMAMAPQERIDCVPTSYGVNLSLATPNRQVSALKTEVIFEALTKQNPRVVG